MKLMRWEAETSDAAVGGLGEISAGIGRRVKSAVPVGSLFGDGQLLSRSARLQLGFTWCLLGYEKVFDPISEGRSET